MYTCLFMHLQNRRINTKQRVINIVIKPERFWKKKYITQKFIIINLLNISTFQRLSVCYKTNKEKLCPKYLLFSSRYLDIMKCVSITITYLDTFKYVKLKLKSNNSYTYIYTGCFTLKWKYSIITLRIDSFDLNFVGHRSL